MQWRHTFKSIRQWLGIRWQLAILMFLSALTVVVTWNLVETPSFLMIRTIAVGSDRILLARDGQVLQVLRTDFKKRRLAWYKLDQYSPEIIRAVTEAEDRRFRSHFGVDLWALFRATRTILRGQRIQGASTITMQLADLIQPEVLLNNRAIPKGSIIHKPFQIWRALFLEALWSKDQILETYLNLIHLRGEYQGVPALSYAYFNKSPKVLDDEESVAVAAMIASPNLGARTLKRKACTLLQKVRAQSSGSRSPDVECDHLNGIVENILSKTPALPPMPNLAPHLAHRLLQGKNSPYILRTTIDPALQQMATSFLQRQIERLHSKNVHDGAAIILDNKTGDVLAYVGGVPDSQYPYVDGVIAARQAGSSLKPFIYGRAFDSGILTSASILLDEGTAISWAGGVYRPTNYDRQFNGPVSVREALGSSLNVPAVKALITVGLLNGYQVLKSLHFSGLREPDFYGVSMALGAVDIRLEELANAYRTLANAGQWTPMQLVAHEGANDKSPEQVLSAASAYIVGSILSDPNARVIGFGWESPLETAFWTAVKTGTSKDYRDNWCVGFSDRYTVGVWAGNFNAEPMREVSGVAGAGPAWYEIMNELHRSQVSKAPAVPPGVVVKSIRHEWASNEHVEYFIKGTEPDSNVIEAAPDKRAQFVFPAEGSVLVKDPKIDARHIAVFVRFKGTLPKNTLLRLDQKVLGTAISPYKLKDIHTGSHQLALVGPDGTLLTAIHFFVKGLAE